jgi:hypothetical protein
MRNEYIVLHYDQEIDVETMYLPFKKDQEK